jgi:hypothetical protein
MPDLCDLHTKRKRKRRKAVSNRIPLARRLLLEEEPDQSARLIQRTRAAALIATFISGGPE